MVCVSMCLLMQCTNCSDEVCKNLFWSLKECCYTLTKKPHQETACSRLVRFCSAGSTETNFLPLSLCTTLVNSPTASFAISFFSLCFPLCIQLCGSLGAWTHSQQRHSCHYFPIQAARISTNESTTHSHVW